MRRRDFLKTLLGVTAYAALPAIAKIALESDETEILATPTFSKFNTPIEDPGDFCGWILDSNLKTITYVGHDGTTTTTELYKFLKDNHTTDTTGYFSVGQITSTNGYQISFEDSQHYYISQVFR